MMPSVELEYFPTKHREERKKEIIPPKITIVMPNFSNLNFWTSEILQIVYPWFRANYLKAVPQIFIYAYYLHGDGKLLQIASLW